MIRRGLPSGFPRLEVAGWALDGVSAGGCTGELVGGSSYKESVLAYLYSITL